MKRVALCRHHVEEGCSVQASQAVHGPCQVLRLFRVPVPFECSCCSHQGPSDTVRHSSLTLSICSSTHQLK